MVLELLLKNVVCQWLIGKYKVMVLALTLKNVVKQWLIVKLLENIHNLLINR